MKRIALLITILTVLLIGCQIGKELKPSEMNPNDLPDERAFQDEFTREFLQSAEETRPGYYPFLSHTGKYKMDFPAGGVILKKFYNVKSEIFETLFAITLNPDGTESELSIFYYGDHSEESYDYYLEIFQQRLGKEVEFDLIQYDEHDIYYAYYEFDKFQDHVAYMQNKKDSEGLEIIYSTYCTDEHIDLCEKDKNERNKIIYDWVRSINFMNENDD